jgi:hypothetical protein
MPITSIAFPYVDPGQSPKTQFGLIDVVSHLPSVSSSLHQETDGEAHEMAMRMDLGRQRQPGETRRPRQTPTNDMMIREAETSGRF